jgi:predicted unusual protein kinase regulating ubiquinone biosynthesis (AarF/ABC1/UbiB family)
VGRKRDAIKRMTTSWAGRTLATGRVAATLGTAAVRDAVGADAGSVAQSLADQLDGMKGLAMKVGQMVSYLDGPVPPEVQRALRKLQRSAEPMDDEAVAAVIRTAFGAEPEALFDTFAPEPVAAASIGQVHRATFDGHDVAVKVQYPQIAKALTVDLANADRLGRLASLGTPLDLSGLIDELRQRVHEECDYLQEAAFQEHFRARWRDDPVVWIPRAFPARTRGTVLTTSFVPGDGLYAFAERATEAERTRAGEAIFTVAFTSIFGQSCFNGDPHPGNYLFPADGRVAFIDFGCVRFFDAALIRAWKRIAVCVLDGRRADLRDALHDAGFVHDEDRWDFDAQWEVMRHLYRPFLTPGFRYTRDYVRESHQTLMSDNPNFRRTLMPPQWLLANRLQWGLNSVLATLGATGRWPDLFREALAQPTIEGVRPPPWTV